MAYNFKAFSNPAPVYRPAPTPPPAPAPVYRPAPTPPPAPAPVYKPAPAPAPAPSAPTPAVASRPTVVQASTPAITTASKPATTAPVSTSASTVSAANVVKQVVQTVSTVVQVAQTAANVANKLVTAANNAAPVNASQIAAPVSRPATTVVPVSTPVNTYTLASSTSVSRPATTAPVSTQVPASNSVNNIQQLVAPVNFNSNSTVNFTNQIQQPLTVQFNGASSNTSIRPITAQQTSTGINPATLNSLGFNDPITRSINLINNAPVQNNNSEQGKYVAPPKPLTGTIAAAKSFIGDISAVAKAIGNNDMAAFAKGLSAIGSGASLVTNIISLANPKITPTQTLTTVSKALKDAAGITTVIAPGTAAANLASAASPYLGYAAVGFTALDGACKTGYLMQNGASSVQYAQMAGQAILDTGIEALPIAGTLGASISAPVGATVLGGIKLGEGIASVVAPGSGTISELVSRTGAITAALGPVEANRQVAIGLLTSATEKMNSPYVFDRLIGLGQGGLGMIGAGINGIFNR